MFPLELLLCMYHIHPDYCDATSTGKEHPRRPAPSTSASRLDSEFAGLYYFCAISRGSFTCQLTLLFDPHV